MGDRLLPLYRFLIPQSLLVFSLAIAMLMDDQPNIPPAVLQLIEKDLNFKSAIPAIIVGGSLPLTLGFTISSVAAFLLRIVAFIVNFVVKVGKGFSTKWRKKAECRLKTMYDFRKFRNEAEHVEQCLIAELGLKRPFEWIQRRWEYSMLSFNAFIALSLSVLIVLILGISPGCLWFSGIIVVAFILLVNFQRTWQEVIDMDHFLLLNFDRIRKRQECSRKDSNVIQPDDSPDKQ